MIHSTAEVQNKIKLTRANYNPIVFIQHTVFLAVMSNDQPMKISINSKGFGFILKTSFLDTRPCHHIKMQQNIYQFILK